MTDPLYATVLHHDQKTVTVQCPYCNNAHIHDKGDKKRIQRRSPGCGLYLNPQQRLSGYIFEMPWRKE